MPTARIMRVKTEGLAKRHYQYLQLSLNKR